MEHIDNTLPESEENTPLRSEEEQKTTVRPLQSFPFAIVGGTLTAFLSAFLWAAVTVLTKYQIGYMAIAVGLIVGLSVRFFGAGVDKKFGLLGTLLALLGCLAGNFLSQIVFIANEYSYGYLETLSYFDLRSIKEVMFASFSPIDILFYGIAMYEGYRFSFYKDVESSANAWNHPTLAKRKNLAILSFVALLAIVFFLMRGHSGYKTYSYESGAILSEGNIKNGKYDGNWTFYHENGEVLSKGSFFKDLRDGDWEWYSENGILERTGVYQKGIECGAWKNYYENGQQADSVVYQNGRMNGEYVAWYENGNIYQTGSYLLDKQNGQWKTYYENGQLCSKGEMKDNARNGDWVIYAEDGSLREELHYEGEKVIIKNCWDVRGKQTVKDGNGLYATYFPDNKIVHSTGEVKNGEKTGTWKTYFPTGKLEEECRYENDLCKILNTWDANGAQTVKDGNGKYVVYWDNDSVFLTGTILDGLKEGTWRSYRAEGGLMSETEYFNGKNHGRIKVYHHPDQLYFEGEYANGLAQGNWIWYNEDGSLSSTVSYENDKKEGVQLIYDSYGRLIKKETYQNGELIKTDLSNY